MENEKSYDELAKKYSLIPFNEINNEFEISTIEDGDFLLREIRRKIADKLENYRKLLDGLLQPDTHFVDMHECTVFSDQEMEDAVKLYKRLMFFDRLSIETSIDESNEKTAKFINEFYKEWPTLKKEFAKIISKLKESWLKEIHIKSDVGYMG